MIGQRFHRLLVVEEIEPLRYTRTFVRRYRCVCDCGTEIVAQRPNLARGATKSCGCWKRETAGKHSVKHHMSATPEYQIWAGIRKRCYNGKYREFHQYGGRGIRMSDSWKNDFASFYADMGPRPSPNHSIDRIDVNGHYEAGNCRWATDLEQAQHTRRNHMFTYLGEVMTLRQVAIRAGVRYQSLYHFAIRKALLINDAVSRSVPGEDASLNPRSRRSSCDA